MSFRDQSLDCTETLPAWSAFQFIDVQRAARCTLCRSSRRGRGPLLVSTRNSSHGGGTNGRCSVKQHANIWT